MNTSNDVTVTKFLKQAEDDIAVTKYLMDMILEGAFEDAYDTYLNAPVMNHVQHQ